MVQSNILELAKQGDAKSIASAINYLLQDKDIIAQADIKDNCLRVLLESTQVPPQQSSVKFIHQLMLKLAIESIKIVKIYGRQKGQSYAAWRDSIILNNPIQELASESSITRVNQEVNQQNKEEANQEEKQTKSNFWPVWFPYPTSWLKAVVVFGFLSIIGFSIRTSGQVGYFLARVADSPEPFIFFIILGLLSPIVIFAIAHHILHLFLGRFMPSIQAPEIAKHQGLLPGLISWWEGFYGWLVIYLATLAVSATTLGIAVVFIPLSNFLYQNLLYNYNPEDEQKVLIALSVIWIIYAAVIYQVENLFKRRMISTYSNINKPALITPSAVDSPIEVELDRMRGEMGLTSMKGKRKSS